MVKEYVPQRGDIVRQDFNPQSGHEHKGRRPALVISHKEYNARAGLALFCPITSKVKGYPFEVEIDQGKIKGAILSDQVKNLDWKVGRTEFVQKTEAATLEEVIQKLVLIFE